jgi:hypothetical protein
MTVGNETMTKSAALSGLPVLPRRQRARSPRFTTSPFIRLRQDVGLPVTVSRASDLLRKSPAWIDRDL